MNRSNLIFTHGAVFSVGLAAAMIANNFRGPSGSETEASGRIATKSQSSLSGRTGDAGGATGEKSGKNEERHVSGKRSKSPNESLSDIVRITDPFERQRALMDLIDTMGPDQFQAAVEHFRSLDHLSESWGEFNLLLRGWAKADPASALTFMDTQPNNRWGKSTILQTWADKDPGAAERWAIENHQGDGPNPFMASVIRGVAANDLAAATRMAESMPLSRERGEAVDAITRALFLQGPEAAMAYPNTLTDEALRAGFAGAISQRLAAKDPDQAATWVASLQYGDAQNRAARTVADALSRRDPQAAASWVRTLKPEAQAEAARGVIPNMSSSDIAGTARWVSTLAGTPNYDSVVEEFVWSCNSRAPEQSAAWIQGVSNADQQRRLYHRMLGEWSQRDAAAVRQWVQANNVPNDVRRRFVR